nr:PREDICTED: uncharacterized protein LOC109044297 [Bemisia tabaci]
MCKPVLFFALCATAFGHLVDRTLEPGAHGRDVVEAVVHRIHKSGVFSDDKDYLRRVAYAESRFGDDPATYREGYYGGIWQCDWLLVTQHDGPYNAISPPLKRIHEAIKDKMGIDWLQVKEKDLMKPFYSGLAARIHIEQTNHRGIPDDIRGQDTFWKVWYDTHRRQYGDFEKWVRHLLEEDMRTVGGKIDTMMVMDGSGSITEIYFQLALDSLARLVNIFDLQEANVGFVVYSLEVTKLIPLMNNLTMSKLQESIRKSQWPALGTNTSAGMFAAIDEFRKLSDARKEMGIPRLLVVFTDGKHTEDPDPGVAAEVAAKSGIITCALGIGPKVDNDELLRIANNESDFKFNTDSYETLREQIVLIARRAKTVPQTPKMGSETSETLKEVGEKRYYRLGMPQNGVKIKLVNERGETRGYWTYAGERPSSALYDGVLTAGETLIPPPSARVSSGEVRHRRNVSLDAPNNDVMIVLESFATNSEVKMKIVEHGAKSAAIKAEVICTALILVFALIIVLLK